MFENFRKVFGLKNLYRSNEFDLIDEEQFLFLFGEMNTDYKNVKVIDLRGSLCFDKFSDVRNSILTKPVNMLVSELYLTYYKNSSICDKIFYHFSLMDERYYLTKTVSKRGVVEMYMDFLEGCKTKILYIFKMLLESKDIVLINCKYGKDRTGLICMLVMLLCKVSDKDIILEYSKSFQCLSVSNDKLDMINDMKSCGLSEEFIYSKKEYMQNLLKKFRFRYKTVNNYLYEIGFDYLDQDLFFRKYKE
jgi:hypothetical protein